MKLPFFKSKTSLLVSCFLLLPVYSQSAATNPYTLAQASDEEDNLDESWQENANIPNPEAEEEEIESIRAENKNLIAKFKQNKDLFPIPDALLPRVRFWQKIYTQYPESTAVVHDKYDLRIVYGAVANVPKDTRSRRAVLKKAKAQYADILLNLARKSPSDLNSREKEISLKLSFLHPGAELYRQLSHTIRTQIGQKDRYELGLARSMRYLHEIQKIYRQLGLPERLMYLPHVESSFNYEAYSKFGAAGIWQFTRGAARLYQVKINSLVDERRDVLKSSLAAARYLKDKFEILKDWPLAITSYNHGLEGVLRIIRRTGSRDIAYIIQNYRRKPFGFASSNFYCEFLAASEIAANYKKYFPNIVFEKPIISVPLQVQKNVTFKQILNWAQMSPEEFQVTNPAFRVKHLSPQTIIFKGLTIYLDSPERLSTLTGNLDSQLANTFLVSNDWNKAAKNKTNSAVALNQYPTLKIPETKFAEEPAPIEPIKAEPASPPELVAEPNRIEGGEPIVEANKASATGNGVSFTLNEVVVSNLKIHNAGSVGNFKQGQIIVQPEETISHLAEWLGTNVAQIRKWNKLKPKANLLVDKKIKILFTDDIAEKFEQKRKEYHQTLREDFYTNYKVTETKKLKLKKGQSLWTLCYEELEIPLWIFKDYNPHINMLTVRNGAELVVPVISRKS